MAKPGFMMYHGECRALGALNDASFRRVIEGMLKYSETGEEPELKDTTERVVFGLMRTRLDEDDARYQSRIEAGRKGGVASGEARRSKTKQREVCFNQTKQREVCFNQTKQDEATRSMLQPNEARHKQGDGNRIGGIVAGTHSKLTAKRTCKSIHAAKAQIKRRINNTVIFLFEPQSCLCQSEAADIVRWSHARVFLKDSVGIPWRK